MSAPDVRTPAAGPADSDTDTQRTPIIAPSLRDVNDAERHAMRATIEAFEWFTLGRKHRIYRPAGVGALRWWKAQIPHRLVSVGNGYVCVVTEAGAPMRNSLRRNATWAPKLWIRTEMVAWECLLPGNRLFDSIEDLLARGHDGRKMFSLRVYLVFERCGATRPIIAGSTWARLEQEIRHSAGGRNPYAADLPPWMLPPSTGGAV